MGNPLFEDVSPIENGGFPASYVSLPEGSWDFRPEFHIGKTCYELNKKQHQVDINQRFQPRGR